MQKKATQIYSVIRVNRVFFDKLKYLFLGVWFVLAILFYAIYVNLASTAGYYLKEAAKEQNEVEFSYNITKFNMAEYRKSLRDSLEHGGRVEQITINVE